MVGDEREMERGGGREIKRDGERDGTKFLHLGL